MVTILFIEIFYNSSICANWRKSNTEIGQLEAFVAVVREGSFTQAAYRLNLTQPSLSARVHQLEQSLRGQLFQRDKRPVQLTPLGEIFVTYAERALGILEAGQAAIRSAQSGEAGHVRVCCPFSLATYLMPDVVRRFRGAFPLAELHIEAGHSDFAIGQLLDGLVELALAAAFPRFMNQVQVLLRFHDEMVVAVNPAHELAGMETVSVPQLWRYQLLIVHWGRAFSAYLDSLRQMYQVRGSAMSVPLAVALPMMEETDTVTFLPRRLTAVAGLVELHVPAFQFDWDTILATRPGRTLTVLEQAFVDLTAAVWKGEG